MAEHNISISPEILPMILFGRNRGRTKKRKALVKHWYPDLKLKSHPNN